MPHTIAIANRQRILKLDRRRLRFITRQTLLLEEVAAAEISLAIVGSEEMRSLNNEFLGHDYDTDVLSFLLDCSEGVDPPTAPGLIPRGKGKSLEGEIILSAGMALEMAPRFQWDPHDELVYYLVHGLLHLAGYDDLTTEERKRMRTRERQVLATCGLTLRRTPVSRRKAAANPRPPEELPVPDPQVPSQTSLAPRKLGRGR